MIYCPFCGHETDFISAARAAQLLGVTHKTVRRYISQNRFPGSSKVNTEHGETWRIPVTAIAPLIRERQGYASH